MEELLLTLVILVLTIAGRVIFLREKRKIKNWSLSEINDDFYKVVVEKDGKVFSAIVPVANEIEEDDFLKIEGVNLQNKTFLCKSVKL